MPQVLQAQHTQHALAAHLPDWSRRRFLQRSGSAAGALAALPASAWASSSGTTAGAGLVGLPDAPGSLRLLSTRNTFLSQNGGLANWAYAFGTLVDDYSGGVFNPYWGPLGAMVFHGGGHSATFDNSVVLLDLNDLTFKRVSNPTPANGGQFWSRTSGGAPDPAFDPVHCEYGDGQPGAGHSYDTLAIVPPQAGGAACGSLLRVASFAVHVNASCNTGWAHRFDFPSVHMQGGSWTRASVNGLSSYLAPGACSAFDARRKRIWWLAALTSAPAHIRYLDLATGQQVQIPLAKGAALAPSADYDSATLRHDPVRDQLVLSGTLGREMVLAVLPCAAPESGWLTPALSQQVPVVANASLGFDRVPELDAFVMLSSADSRAVYVLRAPEKIGAAWSVQRSALNQADRLEFPTARVVGKRWSYCQAARCFVWMASSTAPVVAYRPPF